MEEKDYRLVLVNHEVNQLAEGAKDGVKELGIYAEVVRCGI